MTRNSKQWSVIGGQSDKNESPCSKLQGIIELKMTEQKTQNTAIESTQPSSRRSFLNILWIGLGFVALAESISLVIAYLLPRRRKIKGGNFETVMNIEEARIITFESFCNNFWYHPTKVFPVFWSETLEKYVSEPED